MQTPPSLTDVDTLFANLQGGRCSREDADRWAAQWHGAAESPRLHPAIWVALSRLHGCDLRHGPGEDYLHTNEQIAEWHAEFLASTAGAAP